MVRETIEMLNRWLLVAFVPLSINTAIEQVRAQPMALELRIGQPDGQESSGCYIDARQIPIQVTVINRSTTTLDVLLQDHDDRGYQEHVLSGMQARLLDASGAVLTKHSIAPGILDREWWTSAYLKSTLGMHEQPGDIVAIPPGQQVHRVIHLTSLLAGGPSLTGQLRAGRYRLRLRLNNLLSNEFQFEVTSGNSCGERRAP